MAGVRRAGRGGQGRDRQRGHREDEQDRDRSGPAGRRSFWAPCLRPPSEERQAEDEQAVGEDRADERGLDHDDQAGLEAEDRDEQLRQVAERGLEDAGLARPEPMAELVRARTDDPGQPGQGDRATRRRRGRGRSRPEAQDDGQDRRADRRGDQDRGVVRPRSADDRRVSTAAGRGHAADATSATIRPCPRTGSRARRARTSSSTPTTRSTGIRGAPRRWPGRGPRTSRSSCRSATRRATGATSWSASRSRTRRPPRELNAGLRRDQGRPRGAARPRPGLHGGRPGDDRRRRLADERVPDARRAAVLRRHVLPARRRATGCRRFRQVLEGVAARLARATRRASSGRARRSWRRSRPLAARRGLGLRRRCGRCGRRRRSQRPRRRPSPRSSRRSTRGTAAGAARRSSRSR